MPDLHTPTGMQQRRNSLRFAPFGPPTVSCVLAAARTCIRQAPPTSRGRGTATSAVLPVRSAASATLEKAMKKGGRDFRPPFLFVSINQMLFFYAADRACLCQIPILSFSCHLECIRLACIGIICRSNHRRRISIAIIMDSQYFGCPHIRFSLIPARPHISCPHIFIASRSGHRQIMPVEIISNKIGGQSRS